MSTGRSSGRRFDHEYGITTHAVLFLTDLNPEIAGDAFAHATHYEAVPIGDFRQLIATLPAGVVERSRFVDAGAGMGRAMILAAEYPFVQVYGIEISPALYEIARENLAKAREHDLRCRDLRLVRDDARIWTYPKGDLVVFLFNPFDGEALERALLAIEAREDAGQTWLLYHTPVHRSVVERSTQWTLHARVACADVYLRD